MEDIPLQQHPIFTNDDVLRQIVQWISLPSAIVAPEAGRTLARFAAVSQACSEPALDALWARCDEENILPLFETTGTVAFEPRGGVEDCIYYLDRHISEAEWNRFQLYARRVRSLVFSGMRTPLGTLDPAMITQFMYHARGRGTHVLPALREASLLSDSVDLFQAHMLAFISPSLYRMSITAIVPVILSPATQRLAEMGNIRHFLSTLARDAPHLEFLELKTNADPSCARSVREFLSLRQLRVEFTDTPVSNAGLIKLLGPCSAITRLTYLSIDLGMLNSESISRLSGFNHLEHLRLQATDSNVTALLSIISSTALRSFEFSPTPSHFYGVEMSQLADCCQKLAKRFSACLESVHFECFRYSHDHGMLSLMGTFSSLLDMHRLRDVTITCITAFSVNDNDVRNMALSWPNLRKLELQLLEGAEAPSVFSLAEFARHCPYLRILHLPSVHGRASTYPVDNTQSLASHGLRKLVLGYSGALSRRPVLKELVADDPSAVAAFLQRMFPLAAIDMDNCDLSTLVTWNEVLDRLSVLRGL